jgi:hypothetical protein
VSVARRSDAGGSALRFAPWNNGPSAGDLRHVCGGDLSRAQRMFDLVGALAGLAAFAPAMTVIAVAVLIENGRPVLR